MIKPIHSFAFCATMIALASCKPMGGDEDYDTAGYETSDPYGVPAESGYESAPYQEVNPSASDPSYGSAAYEATTPAAPSVPAAPSESGAVASTHTVVKGDTLWGLSRKYSVSVDALRAANGMTAADSNIRLGQSISIPAQ